jgi:hypothetical protein
LAYSIVAIGCRAPLVPFNRLEFFRDLAPLTDEIKINHAEGRIWACECTMMTLRRLLSTVFGPA